MENIHLILSSDCVWRIARQFNGPREALWLQWGKGDHAMHMKMYCSIQTLLVGLLVARIFSTWTLDIHIMKIVSTAIFYSYRVHLCSFSSGADKQIFEESFSHTITWCNPYFLNHRAHMFLDIPILFPSL